MRRLILIVVCAAAPALGFPAAGSAIKAQDYPNDPDFARCETEDPVSGCRDDEQFQLYGPLEGDTCKTPLTGEPTRAHPDGGLPCWAFAAHDPEHSAGVNDTGAWEQGNTGRPDELIAYIEGGVNYSSNNVKDALDHIYLNQRELPFPQDASGNDKGTYDLNGDGRFGIADWAEDKRVNPACKTGEAPFVKREEGTTRGCAAGGQHDYLNNVSIGGEKTAYLSPEDLIAVFSDKTDADHNGYVDDISGWNFDRNTNDPQTEDLGYGHAPGLLSDLVGVANNNWSGVGICRDCTVVPVKQGPECLGRTDRWSEAILYATDLGADVISSVVVSYQYSRANQRAIDYAYEHGVLLSLDSNDFDAMDHTDGMLWDHVFPGNSLTTDKEGDTANATQWFRARSSVTSYGTHNLFSGGGNSTSGATPFVAAMLAMVDSAGRNASDKGELPPGGLTPDEVKQVLMNTASPVIPQTQAPEVQKQWPGNPSSATDEDHTNWSTQYGYGRPNLGEATKLVMSGKLPPTAEISSPRWFQYVDPARQKRLDVRGSLARARVGSGGGVAYTLEYALGADPADSDFVTVSKGDTTSLSGALGAIDLTKIPRDYYAKDPGETLQPDGAEQYTLTIRLRVRDGNGLKAEDRRSIGIRHDPDLQRGFPKYIGDEMGSAPLYADLTGRHELDLVLPTQGGQLHVFRPNGRELRGFPVRTDTLRSIDPRSPQNYPARAYRTNKALREMRDPLAGAAVADLHGDGRLEIVATSSNADVYAWDSKGKRLRGFRRPKMSQRRFWTLPVPTTRAATEHSRLPARGAFSPPVLANLDGKRGLEILMSAYDGRVYAWHANGRRVKGWPVEVKLPKEVMERDGVDPEQYIRDAKLMYAPGVADLLGTGRPQVFVSSFECNGRDTSTENLAGSLLGTGSGGPDSAMTWMYGIWPDGKRHKGGPYLPHWPAPIPTLSFCYDQSIDFVGEAPSPPVFADTGDGTKLITSGITGTVKTIDKDGNVADGLDPACSTDECAAKPPYRPGDTHTITLSGQAAFGDLTGDGVPEYSQSSTGIESILIALGQTGESWLPQVYSRAWDVKTGDSVPGFPRRQDGFPFYATPQIADLGGDGSSRQVIETNDNYWVHAFAPGGGEAPGFPKYTGQWMGFAGVIGDPRMDGKLRYANMTREGYLYVWNVHGDAARNDQWWSYRHDERNTGLYGLDTRRPASIAHLMVKRLGGGRLRLTWTAPGDDYMTGTARRYQLLVAGRRHRASLPKPAKAGARQTAVLKLRRPARRLRLRAVDDAGNLGAVR